ncbi:MAG TPA: dipicolinate synthase subunit B [Syntrophaceticus sp.]|jgi:dipicolinate synthase subunit B|uniref:Spore dipicolinate synthase subunit B n=1 Tax=Syntrophaceticus schinkii TaxID=499207 RepID=A0A0B7MA16_9FIRM|nr:dipicolinate synthase subunit B [Syntrophaceticus schinkii]HHY31046.1 dipicolinate synthase subunit B [Syntrophaceticus sp.]MDD2359204.1 dipicolinate synthase subunit B [Syntrophaceticus schinkii]MDD4260837.1 dipicolinate synthase subunit B [Syntrophaceticus schinkii]MDD4675235.1 dipicolinate synthase subunit B [Syntrophaceticus schinkii]CEO87324.1 spore dipicolinate synthase subunit B [Syntrophaceticus schinkii]
MRLKGIRVGFVVTGSHCTLAQIISQIEKLISEGAEVFPVVSNAVSTTDTRFGKSTEWCSKLQELTKKPLIKTVVEAEPIGPGKLFDILIAAPCTGNTLAKLANGITDTTALMAIKAHLRNQRPVVIAISTNDGLGLNAKNIAALLNTKSIYLVPFGQDNPAVKPNSLVAQMDKIIDTICHALEGKQVQPLLVEYKVN